MNLLYHTCGQRFRCPIYDEVYATKVVGSLDYIINSDGNVGDTYSVCLENIASLFFGQPTSLNMVGIIGQVYLCAMVDSPFYSCCFLFSQSCQ